MKEQVDEIQKQVNEIHTALIGNDTYEQEGLIHDVQKNTKHRQKSAKRMGFITGISAVIGAGIKAIWEWMS